MHCDNRVLWDLDNTLEGFGCPKSGARGGEGAVGVQQLLRFF